MRVLVTGHLGYIGSVLTPMLVEAGHDVVGLDSNLFADCMFGPQPAAFEQRTGDIRDLTVADLEGFDAVARRTDELQLIELVRALDPTPHDVRVIDDHQFVRRLLVTHHFSTRCSCPLVKGRLRRL